MSLIQKQEELERNLAELDAARSEIQEKFRSARRALDSFIKDNGDVKQAEELRKKREDFSKRVLPEKTEADIEWFNQLKKRNETALHDGVRMGWWDSVENGVPIPFATTMKRSDFSERATMADVVVALGLFPSISEAKRNGRSGPITLGEHRFKNGKFGIKRVIIE